MTDTPARMTDAEIDALCKRLEFKSYGNYKNPEYNPKALAAIRQLQSRLKALDQPAPAVESATGKAHERDLEAVRLFVENLYDDAPNNPYDNGCTRDGWQMACNKIQGYVEGVQKARAAIAAMKE